MPTFNKEDIQNKYSKLTLGGDQQRKDKWIVLTTIQAPTDDVKSLAAIEGWQVVVVGDTKTPADWSWPNCHFISVQFQEQMGLRLSNVLPHQSYARKNMGYLYAIANGAKDVYETDDDNRPFDNLKTFQYSQSVSGLMFAGSRHFNPYQYFGQSTIWQRGYPLGEVGGQVNNKFRVSRNWPTPLIQQGVVNGDPDVDAIFRLTRKFTNRKLEVTFDPAGPPVMLPPGVFSPTNTQNTLFRYEAFWGLFVPVSLNMRTCDIWRGYIVQRLLWEIGGYQAFYPPNAFQVRNSHDLMADMSQENQMYFVTKTLLAFLSKWACPQNLSFFQCIYKLMADMVEKGDLIFDERDVTAIRIWLEDLVILGYKEPGRIKIQAPEGLTDNGDIIERRKADILKRGTPLYYAPNEQREPTISWQPLKAEKAGWNFVEGVFSHCPQIKDYHRKFVLEFQSACDLFHDVLLIIYIKPDSDDEMDYGTLVENMEFYYRPMFPNMAYCGHNDEKFLKDVRLQKLTTKQTFIKVFEEDSGYYSCVSKALQANYKVAGYLAILDDVIISLRSLLDFGRKTDDVWMMTRGTISPLDKSLIIGGLNGQISFTAALNALAKEANNSKFESNSNFIFRNASDFVAVVKNLESLPFADGSVFYIPNRLQKLAETYFSYFETYGVASEIAIPTVLLGIEDKQMEEIKPMKDVNIIKREEHKRDRRLSKIIICQFVFSDIEQYTDKDDEKNKTKQK